MHVAYMRWVAVFRWICCARSVVVVHRHIAALADRLKRGINSQLDGVVLNGPVDDAQRYIGNVNLSFSYVEGESLIMGLKVPPSLLNARVGWCVLRLVHVLTCPMQLAVRLEFPGTLLACRAIRRYHSRMHSS